MSKSEPVQSTMWFRTVSHTVAITTVQVTKETPKQITFSDEYYRKGRTASKRSSYECYFPTWEEAKDHLIQVQSGRVADARRALERANSALGNAVGMKKPEFATPPQSPSASGNVGEEK